MTARACMRMHAQFICDSQNQAMGTAESLLYYDEGGGGDVQGSVTEDRTGSGGSSSSSNQPASLHRAPSPSAGSTRPSPPSSIPPARDQNTCTSGPSSRQRRDIGEARRQGNGGNQNEQSPPLTLRGYVIGSSSTGKTSLVRRLRGENPFAEDADVAGAGAKQQQQHKQRPQRKRKMMALVPWRDRQSGQNCQLHVVEKTSDDAAQTAHDVAMEALGDRPDFCICMVDPRSESSVEFAKTAIDALLNVPLDDRSSSSRRTKSNTNTSNNNLTPLDRPNICVLINYMDLIKIVESGEDEGGDNDDGLHRMTQSRLMDICAEIIETNGASDDPRTVNIGPSIQIYPSSMVSCSGLTSLHSFIMLPYMRKKEVRLLQQLGELHRCHNKSMAALRDGGVKAMQQAIDEGKARMSTAPPVSSGRRSIIQVQKGQGNVVASGKSAAAGWEKRVRIDETRNTNHFEGDEPPLPPKSTPSVRRHEDIDEMTQRLQEADQARRRRRQQALGGEKSTSEDGTAKRSSSAKQESSSYGRRSIISSKQRDAMQDAISKVPTPLKQKQQEKQTKNIAADPMKALEDFLGTDSDSDVGGEPAVRSTFGSVESDNDDPSSGGSSSDTDGDDEGPRPSILLSDSDSEDDDFYYDEGGHAHYSHLDDRLKKPSAEEEVDEKSASEQVKSVTEEPIASGDVETPPKKRDSKTLRSNHDEEEKKDESPSGRSYAVDEEASSDPSSPRVEEEGADRVNVGGDSIQEGSNQEILHSDDENSVSTPIADSKQSEDKVEEVKSAELDSEDESVADGAELSRPEILHSDDEDSVGGEQSADPDLHSDDEDSVGGEQSADPTPAVEILHSDDDDDNDEADSTKQAAVEILHSDNEGSNRELESKGIEPPNNEVQVLDSEDESTTLAADRPTDILHSDDDNDDDVKPSSLVPLPDRPPVVKNSGDDSESSQVEILHSDEEEDGDEVPLKPSEPMVSASIDGDEEDEQQTEGAEQAAPSIDGTLDSDPPVASSSNVLVEALPPNDTDDEREGEPEATRPEEPASTGMSAAVAAALAAAEEEARRLMQATAVPLGVEEERRKKKKKSKDGKKSKKSSKSADAEGKKTKKKKKSKRSSVEDS